MSRDLQASHEVEAGKIPEELKYKVEGMTLEILNQMSSKFHFTMDPIDCFFCMVISLVQMCSICVCVSLNMYVYMYSFK